MSISPKRLVIYAADVVAITGKNQRYCRDILVRVRNHFKKPKSSMVTIQEFCEVMKMPEEQVKKYL